MRRSHPSGQSLPLARRGLSAIFDSARPLDDAGLGHPGDGGRPGDPAVRSLGTRGHSLHSSMFHVKPRCRVPSPKEVGDQPPPAPTEVDVSRETVSANGSFGIATSPLGHRALGPRCPRDPAARRLLNPADSATRRLGDPAIWPPRRPGDPTDAAPRRHSDAVQPDPTTQPPNDPTTQPPNDLATPMHPGERSASTGHEANAAPRRHGGPMLRCSRGPINDAAFR